MKDQHKTKEQLIKELAQMRQRLAECKVSEAERKRVEEEVKQLSSAVDQSIDGIAIGDLEPKMTYVNDAFAQMHGYSPEEMMGMKVANLHNEEQMDEFKTGIDQIMTQGSWMGEIGHVRKDGAPFPTYMSVTLLKDSDGNPTGIVAVARDITERKRAEGALRESEEKFSKAFRSSPIPMVIAVLEDGRAIDVNESLLHMTGYCREEFRGRKRGELGFWVNPENHARIVQILRDQGQIRDREEEYRIKSGEIRTALTSAEIVHIGDELCALYVLNDITERKRAEEALRETENRYKAIFDNRLQMVYINDGKGLFLDANDYALERLGYTRDDLGKVSFQDMIHPDDLPAILQVFSEILTKGSMERSIEIRLVTKSGEIIWVETFGIPLERDVDHYMALGIANDITERKKAEEALRESEEKYRHVVERANDGILIIQDGTIKYANRRAEELSGYIFAQTTEAQFINYLHPDEIPKVVERYQRRMAGEDVEPVYETIMRREDGSDIYVEINAGTISYRGEPADLVFIHDITERKQAEQALRQSEYKFRTALESARDGILITSNDGSVVDINRTLLNALGYDSKEQVIGRNSLELLAVERSQKQLDGVRREMAQKGHISNVELMGLTRDGRKVPVEVTVSNMTDDEGQPAGSIVVIRDITQRKRAEEALKESEELSRGMLEAATIGIYIVQDGKFQYVNPQFEHIGGYTADDFLGKDSLEHVHSEDREMVRKKAIEQLKGQSTQPYEYRFICKGGGELWILEKVSSIQYKGKPAAIGSFIDITERKQAEGKLERLNLVLRTIGDVNQLIAKEKDRDKLIKATCDAFLEHSSYYNAWMALFDESGELVATAEAGLGNNFLPMVDQLKRGQLTKCGRRALRQSGVVVTKDPSSTCRDCSLADKYPGRAAITTRIEYEGRVYGLLSASMPRAFITEEQELSLFKEVAADIAFALYTIELEVERKRMEEALRESEERLRALIQNAPDAIYTNDLEGNFTSGNKKAEELVGYSRQELTGENFFDKGILPGEYVPKAIELLERNRRGEPTGPDEFELVRKDGTSVVVEISTFPVNRGGEVEIMGIARDITERKKADEALRESEEKLRATFGTMSDAIAVTDVSGNLVDINEATVRLLGYRQKEELIGRNALDLIAERDRAKAAEDIGKALVEGDTSLTEYALLTENGGEVEIEASAALLRDGSGNPAGVIAVMRDITERKRAEEEIHRYNKRLEALHAISAAVSQTMDLDEMLNSALEKVLEVTETQAGYIHLYDWERKELALRAHRGISEKYAATLERLPVSEKVIRRWQNKPEPSFRARGIVSELADSEATAAELEDGIAVLATLPLASKSGMHGGLTLVGGTRRWFSPEELELLKAICNEIAVGIENAELLERTRELSVTDELTELYNRRHFYEVLENEMARTQRYGGCFTLAMLDLDEFKQYNDRFGHTNGDAILRSVGQTLRSQLRNADMVFRYGGDEFTLVLPATDAAKARKIVDRIRVKRLQGLKADNEGLEHCLGFSAGIAQFPENAETADALVFLADAALYRSKRGGGGKSTLVSELGGLAAGALDSATMDQVYALAAMVDAKDPHTYGHSKRVATISEMIGKEIALQPKELADLRAAALLHDIGKVGVPDSILTKSGKPTEHEWKILKKHPVEGARIIGYVKELEGLVPLVRHHHEWCNGTGYPDGLRGEDIPLGARIISIADAYDTMTTQRPYRDVVSQEEALEELRRCSGTQFDSELVEAFGRALNRTIQQDAGKMKSPSLVTK